MSAQRFGSNTEPEPTNSLSVDLKPDGAALVVRINGELDMATAIVLKDAMRPYLGLQTPVSYDLAALTFIDCAGLRALLDPVAGNPFSSQVSLRSASRCVRRLLELLQLQSMLDTESSDSLGLSPV